MRVVNITFHIGSDNTASVAQLPYLIGKQTAELAVAEAAEKADAAEAFVKKVPDKASEVGCKRLGGVTFGMIG